MRVAVAVFLSSETGSLMAIRDHGEFRSYFWSRFVGILHMTVRNSLKTASPIPDWANCTRGLPRLWRAKRRHGPRSRIASVKAINTWKSLRAPIGPGLPCGPCAPVGSLITSWFPAKIFVREPDAWKIRVAYTN
jgi:hypothetical protein